MLRPQGCESVLMTADGTVESTNKKNVYSLVVVGIGATEGDYIQLKDGGASGTVRVRVVMPNDNDTVVVDLGKYGIRFAGEIYYDEVVNAAGRVFTTVVLG
jgi:hypothetical protein